MQIREVNVQDFLSLDYDETVYVQLDVLDYVKEMMVYNYQNQIFSKIHLIINQFFQNSLKFQMFLSQVIFMVKAPHIFLVEMMLNHQDLKLKL